MKQDKAARAVVDISHTPPTAYDPLPTWPYTVPDPRSIPYGKPGKKVSVLILPGKIEYDPAMHLVEQRVRKMVDAGRHVTIVVPDYYRGVGEILSRRQGLNLLVVNTDKSGAESLPSFPSLDKLKASKVARRRVLMECDVAYIIDNCPVRDEFEADIERSFSDMKTRVFKHVYVKKVADEKKLSKAEKKLAKVDASKVKKSPGPGPVLSSKKNPAARGKPATVEGEHGVHRATY